MRKLFYGMPMMWVLLAVVALAMAQNQQTLTVRSQSGPLAGKPNKQPVPLPSGGGVRTKINPKDGAKMIYIPAGAFLMGSTEREGFTNEMPQHRVYLDGYWIYKNLVTVGMYKKFCQETGRPMPPAPIFNPILRKEDHPIVLLSWEDAKAYCQWAGVSLPMEAQWEKAARGTDGRIYPWGIKWDASKCVNTVGSNRPGGTKSVGSCPQGASPYGVLDMAGNVWQWCADWYNANYYKRAPDRNPTGPASGTFRVLRGGSWSSGVPVAFRAAFRRGGDPAVRDRDIGFRCASLSDFH